MLSMRTNVASLVAQRHLANATNRVAHSYARLSSGLRIVRPSDDLAGWRMADGFAEQARGLRREQRETSDAIGLAIIAEGGLGSISDIVQRLRELAVSAHDGSKSDAERAQIDVEFQENLAAIDSIAASTKADGGSLLWVSTEQLGLEGANVGTVEDVTAAIPLIDEALDEVSKQRSLQGVRINVLESRLRQLAVRLETTTAAESRIRDVDYAAETAELARAKIMQEVALSILSQANSHPKLVLKLLEQLG